MEYENLNCFFYLPDNYHKKTPNISKGVTQKLKNDRNRISCCLFLGFQHIKSFLYFKIKEKANINEQISYTILNHNIFRGAYLPFINIDSKLNRKVKMNKIVILIRIFLHIFTNDYTHITTKLDQLNSKDIIFTNTKPFIIHCKYRKDFPNFK